MQHALYQDETRAEGQEIRRRNRSKIRNGTRNLRGSIKNMNGRASQKRRWTQGDVTGRVVGRIGRMGRVNAESPLVEHPSRIPPGLIHESTSRTSRRTWRCAAEHRRRLLEAAPDRQLMLTAVFELNMLNRSKNSPGARLAPNRSCFSTRKSTTPTVSCRRVPIGSTRIGCGVVVERRRDEAAVRRAALHLQHRRDAQAPAGVDRAGELRVPVGELVERLLVRVGRVAAEEREVAAGTVVPKRLLK